MSLYVCIQKKLGDFKLDVTFDVKDEVLALLGPSGCGKSMTLKCIAGIVTPDRGKIILDGVTLFDSEKKINLTPQQRRVGFTFQNYALFPNMTVRQNVEAGARREKEKRLRREKVEGMLEKMGLTPLADQYPKELSGGQQQRVALARTLVSDPNILLFDEPFSALDSHLRFQMEHEVRKICREFGKTTILVSHNRDEVYRLADQIAIVHGGRIEAIGDKRYIFQAPKTKNGAILTGCKNISEIEVIDETHIYAKQWKLTLAVPAIERECLSSYAYVGIRMHDIHLLDVRRKPCSGSSKTESPGSETLDCLENVYEMQIAEILENPFSMTIFLQTEGEGLLGMELEKEKWKKYKGQDPKSLKVYINPSHILLLE